MRYNKTFLLRGAGMALALSLLTSCGNQPESIPAQPAGSTPPARPAAEAAEFPVEATLPREDSDEEILIAYFSLWDNAPWGEYTDNNSSASVVIGQNGAVGANAFVAGIIHQQLGGDLHAILTDQPYPADFQAVIDINHAGDGCSIADQVDRMDQYDTVFVGYPVWAGDLPQAVRAFLTGYDWTGKTVIPFCTHNGYGAGRSFSTVEELASGAQVLEGIALDSASLPDVGAQVDQWLDVLPLPEKETEAGAGETTLRITVNGQQVDGVLYDSPVAAQFLAQLPQTISMSNYGGREVYGRTSQEIAVEGEGQLFFADGDITYCPTNGTAAIFYAQSARPDLTMEVYPMGRVTSDLSVFTALPSRVEVTFEVAQEEVE